ncbi:MAG TPA: hypothetical protein VN238_00850 [Solirubrobacteraceae bacterium]|nr:hypothetical protein [Solirubrobacteraceae bacterium]
MEAVLLLLVVWVVLIPVGVTAFLLAYPAFSRRRAGEPGALAPVVPLVHGRSGSRHIA